MRRTFRDIKTIRSVKKNRGPLKPEAVFLEMHSLAQEKHRLEREEEIWQTKVDQISRRLREIEHQMRWLEKATTLSRATKRNGGSRKKKVLTLGY